MPQTGFHDRHLLWEGRCLFEVCHAQVSAEHHGSRLGFFLARDDVEERGLPHPIAGDESYTLTFGNSEADIVEKFLVADGKTQSFDLQIGVHCCHNSLFSVQK